MYLTMAESQHHHSPALCVKPQGSVARAAGQAAQMRKTAAEDTAVPAVFLMGWHNTFHSNCLRRALRQG